MNRNSKDPLYKEYYKALEKLWDLYATRRNNCWVELEKPYKHGYDMTLDLRDDIKRREDAWVYQTCLSLINSKVWCRDKKFVRKLRKGKYEDIRPNKKWIDGKVYEGLHPKVKRHFYKHTNMYGRIEYHCTLSFELVCKIKPHWVTMYYVHDNELAKEEGELKRTMENKFYKFYYGSRGGVKSYAIIRNRKDRAYNKATLKTNLKFDSFDKKEYRYNHKSSAKWDAW